MILYYTGTGNSEYVAKRIADAISDECVNLLPRIQKHDHSKLISARPWVIVYPTYAWRMPRILEKYLLMTPLRGSREIYFVATCGDGIGNMAGYAEKFAAKKSMLCKGCSGVVMPENYIALFKVPDYEEAESIIQRANPVIDQLSELIRKSRSFPRKRIMLYDRFMSKTVNSVFYKMVIKADKFQVSDQCIGCGQCAAQCPMNNIKIVDARPVWGTQCTHCMACICRCPKEAIEYGRKSVGQPRYHL